MIPGDLTKDDKVYTKLRSIARTIQKVKTVDNLPPAWWYVRLTWSSPQSSFRLKMCLFDSLMPKHGILSNGNVAVLRTRRSLAESSEIWWRSSCGPSRQRGDDNSRETNHQFEMRGGRRTGIWLQTKTTMAGPNAEILKSKVSSFSAFGSFRDSFEVPMWSMESSLKKKVHCRNRCRLPTGFGSQGAKTNGLQYTLLQYCLTGWTLNQVT